ncbi:JAB domain-containing protein [Alicyclobacillus fodiniaquatilis]|uniref:RadC family protein n=1 Tax=Alicyclobacillus fodiniaquatilis TaxID=1661150 RepID=A0ABW4JNC6_9BACL
MENIDIVRVVQVREATLETERFSIRSADDAASIFQSYLEGVDREHFVVAALDTKHVINAIHTVSVGSLDATIVHPREVFKFAILANASSIIVCHNHPSGNSQYSTEDVQVTKRLVEAGRILGIAVLDHIVVCDHSFCSLKSMGLM